MLSSEYPFARDSVIFQRFCIILYWPKLADSSIKVKHDFPSIEMVRIISYDCIWDMHLVFHSGIYHNKLKKSPVNSRGGGGGIQ